MADPKAAVPATKPEAEDKATSPIEGGWKYWLIGFTLMAVLAGWHFWPRGSHSTSEAGGTMTRGGGGPPVGGRDYGVTGEGSFVTPKEPLIMKVQIGPEFGDDWISLPNVFKSFHLQGNGSVEFQFLNGAHSRKFQAGDKFNWKNIPDSTFKLRGDPCEATIVVRF